MNNRKQRSFIALMLTLAMLFALPVHAEPAEDLSYLPLLDSVAAAVLRSDLVGEGIHSENPLSVEFLQQFLLAGTAKHPTTLGMSAEILTDAKQQSDLLPLLFASAMPDAPLAPVERSAALSYIGLRLMATDVNSDGTNVIVIADLYEASNALDQLTEAEYADVNWLDKRAVASVCRSEESPCGWKVYSFALDAELQMEDAAQAYFNSTLTEYVSTANGFSIQYPALFTVDVVKEEANGLSGALADGSASFHVYRTINENNNTLEDMVRTISADDVTAAVFINDLTECARIETHPDANTTRVTMLIVTESYIYEAQLEYKNHLALDFSLYSDYMMNSFSVDELGIG